MKSNLSPGSSTTPDLVQNVTGTQLHGELQGTEVLQASWAQTVHGCPESVVVANGARARYLYVYTTSTW
jgi:hypothetical protein